VSAVMVIIAIGWLYVVMMIAAVSDSLLKGVIRFLFLGVLPVGLWLWIKLRQHQARVHAAAEAAAADAPEPAESGPSAPEK
jgi:hypothetical protein